MRAFNSVAGRCLAAFNAANGTTLTMEQVEFTDVRPVDSITPRPNTPRNTAITMKVKRGAPFTGETTLYYDRIQLATPFKNAPLQTLLGVSATTEKTIHELLPLINRRLGTSFVEDEILDAPLKLEKGFDVITVQTTGKSQHFVGSVQLQVTRPTNPAVDLVVPHMGELWYKDHIFAESIAGQPLTQKWPPALRTYLSDYSFSADFLRTVPAYPEYTPITDTAFGSKLANSLKAVDLISWVFTATKTIANLYRAWPIYNGPTKDFNLDPHIDEPYYAEAVDQMRSDEFDNVLVLMTNGAWTDAYGYRSCIVVHYNDEVVK